MDYKDELVQLTRESVTVAAIDDEGVVQRVATMDRQGQRNIDFGRTPTT